MDNKRTIKGKKWTKNELKMDKRWTKDGQKMDKKWTKMEQKWTKYGKNGLKMVKTDKIYCLK